MIIILTYKRESIGDLRGRIIFIVSIKTSSLVVNFRTKIIEEKCEVIFSES